MPKNVQTTAQLHSSHKLAKWSSKFSKPGFNRTWTVNFQMFKLDLKKAEETEIKLLTSVGSSKKQESSRKTSTSALLTTLNKLWKILQEMGTPDHLTWLLRNLCAGQEATVGTRHWNNRLIPYWERSTSRLYCHPAYLTYMQSTPSEIPGWMKHKLKSR